MVRLFISGLREDIKNSVLVHKPKSYEETLDLAHIHERRIQAEKGPIRPAFAKTPPLLPTPNLAPLHQNPSSSTNPNTTSHHTSTRPPLKRSTHVEIQSRRERGLCFYCEENFIPGHKCKSPHSFSCSLMIPILNLICRNPSFLTNSLLRRCSA